MWEFLKKHITAVFLTVVIMTTAMALVIVWKINSIEKQIDVIMVQTDKIITISDTKENILLQITAMNNYAITGKEEYLEQFRIYTDINNKMQTALIEKIRDTRKPLAREMHQAYAEYVNICETKIIPVIKEGGKTQEFFARDMIERQKSLVEMSTRIQKLRQDDTVSILEGIVNKSKNASRTSEYFTFLGILLGVALSFTIGPRFIRAHKINDGILNTTRNIAITIDEKGIVTSVNRTAEVFLEKPRDFWINKKFNEVIGSGKAIDLDLPVGRIISTGIGVCNLERVYTFSDGWRSTLNVDCLPMQDRIPSGVVIVARDISERKILEEKLYAMTLRDSLTNLYNHAYLKRRLKEEVEKSKEKGYPLSYILMDIDDFKLYNDRFGHLAGDVLLKEFAQVLKKCVRDHDIVGRYGGDEFTVILPRAGRSIALMLAERIRSTVENHSFEHTGLMQDCNVTVSVGVAVYPEDAYNSEEIIRLADEAMYRCKQNNKNGVQMYFSALKEFQKELKGSEEGYFHMIQVLMGVINAKDRDTYLHLEKVAEYVEEICKLMDLSEKDIKDIKAAAFLHDLGKIEIPRTILNKNGPLSENEWAIVKQHPNWGASMVLSMQNLDSAIPQILHHHERYDGKGYPNGIRGEEIPLGARIIAVADSFDALTTSRPYRSAKSNEEALEEISRHSGTQFDPLIAQIFINSYKKAKRGIQIS
ncbi:MAG: diguanylate cyclase [Actinobacteria bacterium]|nr:diguanylate cyclase [Actinomycetota bacterium]